MTAVVPTPSIKHGSYKCHLGIIYNSDIKGIAIRLCNKHNESIYGFRLMNISKKTGLTLCHDLYDYNYPNGAHVYMTRDSRTRSLCIMGVDDI